MKEQIILQAVNIHKNFLSGTQILRVLRGLDIELRQGEILAIVGASGVGKSTLLHILGTLDRPTSGKVYFDGQDIFRLPDKLLANFRNQKIGFIFQFHYLLPEFSALENVMMPSLIAGRNYRQVLQQAKSLLDEVELSQRLSHKPAELSGGEQQRVAVARALMNNPIVVLADEPSGNLDRTSSDNLHRLIWKICKTYHRAFIIVTHNEELAAQADRTLRLIDGKTVPYS